MKLNCVLWRAYCDALRHASCGLCCCESRCCGLRCVEHALNYGDLHLKKADRGASHRDTDLVALAGITTVSAAPSQCNKQNQKPHTAASHNTPQRFPSVCAHCAVGVAEPERERVARGSRLASWALLFRDSVSVPLVAGGAPCMKHHVPCMLHHAHFYIVPCV